MAVPLSCSTLASYQWYLNGQSINGATSSVYTALQTGYYSVIGSDGNGCSATSGQQYVTVSGINDLPDNDIRIYPNPSNSFWQLELPASWIGAQYELFDANGNVIAKADIRTTVTTVTTELSQGVYFIKINSGQQSVVRKLIRL